MDYLVDQPLDAFIQTKKRGRGGRGGGRGRAGGRGRGRVGATFRRTSIGGGGGGGFRRQANRVRLNIFLFLPKC